MKTVILAAGYATRLRPYTRSFPKTLLRVAGKPLLDETITRVAASNRIDGVYVVTNNLHYPAFLSWQRHSNALSKVRCPVEILNDRTGSNQDRLGSIGDLLHVVDQAGLEEDLLVICSDKVFTFDVNALCLHAAATGGVVNTYQDVGDPALLAGRYGCLQMEPDGRVIRFQEKPAAPASSCKSIAFYVYPRKVIPLIRDYISKGDNPDAPGYLSQWLCTRTPMYGWPIDGECLDVGDPASYREANRVCWGRQGVVFQELRPFLETRGSDADLGTVIEELEQDLRVTMVTVGVSGERVEALAARFVAEPRSVPVNVVPRTDGPVADQAAARGANCAVISAPGGAPVDLSRVTPAGEGEPVPVI